MVHVLYPGQIKDLKTDNEWPSVFDIPDEEDAKKNATNFKDYRNPKSINSDDSDSDGSLEENMNQLNRPVVYLTESSDDSSEGDAVWSQN